MCFPSVGEAWCSSSCYWLSSSGALVPVDGTQLRGPFPRAGFLAIYEDGFLIIMMSYEEAALSSGPVPVRQCGTHK